MVQLLSIIHRYAIFFNSFFVDYAKLAKCYNIFYQSFMPNCKLSVEVLRRHYHISSETISYICNGRTIRICNQRVLTFLLTEFEKDNNISKFFFIMKQLVQLPDLRRNIDQLRDGLAVLIMLVNVPKFV